VAISPSSLANALIPFGDVSLRLRYNAGKYRSGNEEVDYPAVDQLRPLSLLKADLPTLYAYAGNTGQIPPPERSRPRQELRAATLLQTVSTSKPWEEEWVGFWRDHFSVFANDMGVGAYLPHWDREVIRRHCLGNFQSMLEATAQHPCMLTYLNNRSSRAGNANENYARELFELHTLGRDAYLNNLYAKWRSVPGADQGKPQGYIDQDVYEAARAFTGWTMENGASIGGGQSLPKTGRFIYVAAWHDNYQKRVLATEFEPYAAAMADGKRVLSQCANHPATAEHIAKKMVQRFVNDQAPPELVKSTAQVFYEQRKSPKQLQLVYEHVILQSASIPESKKQKARKPMQLIGAFVKATNIPFSINDGAVMGPVESAGLAIYGWPSPDGPPDGLNWVMSASFIRQRAQLIQGIAENTWGSGEWDPFDKVSSRANYAQLLAYWEMALFKQARPELSQALLSSQNIRASETANDVKKARKLIGLLACAPSFQTEVLLPSPAKAGITS
jgi:uncharacterized protein (DUF1800 family)